MQYLASLDSIFDLKVFRYKKLDLYSFRKKWDWGSIA